MAEIVGEAAGERLAGGRPSRTQSFLAAAVTGFVVAVTTYKVLRSGESGSATDGRCGGSTSSS